MGYTTAKQRSSDSRARVRQKARTEVRPMNSCTWQNCFPPGLSADHSLVSSRLSPTKQCDRHMETILVERRKSGFT